MLPCITINGVSAQPSLHLELPKPRRRAAVHYRSDLPPPQICRRCLHCSNSPSPSSHSPSRAQSLKFHAGKPQIRAAAQARRRIT
jgi:hypothetical protein